MQFLQKSDLKKKELCFRNYIKSNIVSAIVNLPEDRSPPIPVTCTAAVVVTSFLKSFPNSKADILTCESVFWLLSNTVLIKRQHNISYYPPSQNTDTGIFLRVLNNLQHRKVYKLWNSQRHRGHSPCRSLVVRKIWDMTLAEVLYPRGTLSQRHLRHCHCGKNL